MRARNIKPSLLKNELLAVADPLYTLIFAGLWMLADREGRLEDRPAKIHFDLNPGRVFDGTQTALAWLADNGFIQRYEVEGTRYIQVTNFVKHQNPHCKEAPSTIPAPCEHQTSTSVARLIPSSLIPDSLIPPPTEGAHEVVVEKKPRPTRKCPVEFVVSETLTAWAKRETPQVDVARETAKLRDYTYARAISDWNGAWRNWMRKAQDDISRQARRFQAPPPPKKDPPTQEQMSAERRKAAEANRRELALKVGAFGA